MFPVALKKLSQSSKATVLLVTIVALSALVYTDKVTVDQLLGVLKYLVPTWFVAHAGETGAKALAAK